MQMWFTCIRSLKRLMKGEVYSPTVRPPALQDGGEHGGGGALAVGAGDVDKFQLFFRVADALQQLPGAAEAGDAPLPADAVDIGQGFAVVHDDYLISF